MSHFYANKKILVPFDFSDDSKAALNEALAMSDDTTQICVQNVLLPLNAISIEPGMIADFGEETDRVAHVLQELKDRLDEPQYERLEYEVSVGDPGTSIYAFAKSWGADLIVMSSHGRTGLGRLLIGSVAERVIRLAECPVLVLRGPRD